MSEDKDKQIEELKEQVKYYKSIYEMIVAIIQMHDK